MQLRILILTVCIGFSLSITAQPSYYPKYYFRNPLGIPMELQANFGELRPDHWHMGLDLRTNQKENLPVYAAAGGYIASLGIRPQSFGRFIIINHPNGLSTLYAHLNDFYPALEQYVTEQQYKQKSWAIELNFTKNQFPVYKSQFIAYSGNTGGSQGPHLHFEIFDTKTEKRLNPLLFGFPVSDNVPPTLVKLAMYDRSKSTYAQSPLIFPLKKTDSGYIIPKIPVIKTGLNKISFAIQAYDRMSNSKNPDGIYSAKMYLDDEPQIQFILDSIDYDETVYINAQVDYKYRYNGGAWLQHLFQLPGDHGSVYKKIKGDGVIILEDTLLHLISIEVKDANQNSSMLNFSVQKTDSLSANEMEKIETGKYGLESYRFIPNQANELKNSHFEMYFPSNTFYDTVRAVYFWSEPASSYSVSGIHYTGDASIPLHNDFNVRVKPEKEVPEDWKTKLIIKRNSNGSNIKKANWDGQWLTANFGDFGTFQAFADLIPPSLNELGKGDTVNLSPLSGILFTPTDNFGIKSFKAELDSQWVRFINDKSRNWVYVFDERCPYGVHHLKVTVEDLVGNTTIKEWWFKKFPYTPPKKKVSSKKKVKSGTNKKTFTKKKK